MLSNRLSLAMVVLVLATAVGVGALAYRSITDTTIPLELNRLQMHADQRAKDLDAYVRGTRADTLATVNLPAITELAEAHAKSSDSSGGSTKRVWRDRIAQFFASQMSAKPTYLQFRFINGSDGQEIVRVDRSGPEGAIRIVVDEELQNKSMRAYFVEGMSTRAGDAFVSPIELNREHGEIEVPHVPVLRVAAPVYHAINPAESTGKPEASKPIGVVVINVNMAPALESFQAMLHDGCQRFVANMNGDYIVNTLNPRAVFASEFGQPASWRDDFPNLVPTVQDKAPHARVLQNKDGIAFGAAIATTQLAGGPKIVVIDIIPHARIVDAATSAFRSSMFGAILAVGMAIVAAVVLARSLTRPLTQVTHAVDAFAADKDFELPEDAKGEIGVLAQAFSQMAKTLRSQTDSLRNEIQARRKTEAELQAKTERERMFLAVVQSSIDPIMTSKLDGTITAWNPAAENTFGYSAEEAIGQNLSMLTPPARLEELDEVFASILDGEPVNQYETVRLHKSGTTLDVSVQVSPLLSTNGDVIGISKIIHDISAHKRAEENFRQVISSAPTGICVVDEQGNIRLVNPAVAHLFGYHGGELLGQPIEKLIPARYQSGHIALRAGYTHSPETRPMGEGRDLQALRKDGTEFDVEVGLSPIRGGSGVQILCSIVDVTERKRAHRTLSEYASQLERSNGDLQQFAYVVSHDLKAPLRGIASVADWLAKDFGDVVDDDARENIDLMLERIHRLDRLIAGILSYSRAGQKSMERIAIDTEELILGIVDSIAPPDDFDIRIEGSLPIVLFDETQLQQVFQNLLVNAIQHMDKPAGKVVISCRKGESGHQFSVEDNGPGIPEQHFDRIFGLFQTLTPKDVCKSAGAGLAIVKRIVERNEGEVQVTSNVGRGTKFTFSVPKKYIATHEKNSEHVKS